MTQATDFVDHLNRLVTATQQGDFKGALKGAFDSGFSLPPFKSEMEAALHALEVYAHHRYWGVYAYFVSGGPMHPAPPRITKAIHDVTGVYVLYTAGCEHYNYESTFNAVYNAIAGERWIRDSARCKVVRQSLIRKFMSLYYTDPGGAILNDPEGWADKYLWPDEEAFGPTPKRVGPAEFEREMQLADLIKEKRGR